MLEEYLRHYVTANQHNWVDLLDVAQFCDNLHQSSSTRMSPFELATGQQPMTPNEVAKQRAGGRCPAAYRFARARTEQIEEAKDCLTKAARRMKKYADRGRRFLEFQVGDKVMLKLTPQVWKKISKKQAHRGLIQRYDGPFEVTRRIGKLAYRLELPERLKLHPVFHVSFLKPFHEDPQDGDRAVSKRAPPTIRTQFEKEAEAILDRKVEGQSKKNRRVYYLVKWKGAPIEEASWERDTTLWQFEDFILNYLQSMRTSTSSSGGGPVTPTQDGSPECRRADRSLARMQVMCGTLGVTGHVESTTHVRITDAGFEVWVRMHHAARGDAACTVGDWYAWRHVGKEALLGAQVASEWAKLGPSPSSYGDVDH